MSDGSEFDDEMLEFLQVYLDETGEQLDDLVDTMLALEANPQSQDDLNEAFRLIHSIKGSAGMMGLDNITALTHQLESRFEKYRSGEDQLDEATMNVVLKSIDYLRDCNEAIRNGKRTESALDLLEELSRIESQPRAEAKSEPQVDAESQSKSAAPEAEEEASPAETSRADEIAASNAAVESSVADSLATVLDRKERRRVWIRVAFRQELQLADLKARLIVTRLGEVGEVLSTDPDLVTMPEMESVAQFIVEFDSGSPDDQLRSIVDVDGVEEIEISEQPPDLAAGAGQEPVASIQAEENSSAPVQEPIADVEGSVAVESSDSTESVERSRPSDGARDRALPSTGNQEPGSKRKSDSGGDKVAETMRVDIDRLDNLMNLTGELVINRARFIQIASQMSPAFRKPNVTNRIREFCDGLRTALGDFEAGEMTREDQTKVLQQLRAGLQVMDDHVTTWEHSRQHVEKMNEAIDQLSLVSHSLQQGVFDTRMVPIGPLFTRFKRVVRDLSKERGKQVNLEIRGEKTELDKRMIDELGDPLIHLVRNSIDHGMESPAVRTKQGKSETGTIVLEATHSGNSVSIHVRDDGGGIDVQRIRAKIVDKGMLSQTEVDQLSDQQALEFIWKPGFSTAGEVTNVSGRGVGMDVVQDRIRQLNGSIELESEEGRGTHFTLRLPLTLAIIRCLLVRLRGTAFSMPIESVREIVSVQDKDVISVKGRRAFDVRGEIVHLVGINDLFDLNLMPGAILEANDSITKPDADTMDVVIVQSAGKTMGLLVDSLIGSQDMVIKSLADNFVEIRGLSGASILGDGNVCLMLDVGVLFQLAKDRPVVVVRPGSIRGE